MKATISLEGLWTFLQSLSLSANNKRWLGEKLLEEAQKESADEENLYANAINSLCGAWKDDPRSMDEIINEIRDSRQFGVTRHIASFDNDEK
ncbi:hypothetical protein [Phocaeicola sp.]